MTTILLIVAIIVTSIDLYINRLTKPIENKEIFEENEKKQL